MKQVKHKKNRQGKKLLFATTQLLLTFSLVVLLMHYDAFLVIERGIADAFFLLRQPPPGQYNPQVSDRVKLLAFDEDSLAHLGRWPWKRYVHARFLDRLQVFRPLTVMFDLLFIDHEKVPSFLLERLDTDKETLDRIAELYTGMDQAFADEMARHNNVYTDLQLMDRPRSTLPQQFQKRIAFTEVILAKTALKNNGHKTAFLFDSLEPLLPEIARSSHPAVINVPPDSDGTIRQFPLFYFYEMPDGQTITVPTVILSLYAEYCRVALTNIQVNSWSVKLPGALLPERDITSGGRIAKITPVIDLLFAASNPEPPADYRYSEDLYRLINNLAIKHAETNNAWHPPLPVSIWTKDNGYIEIIDGWEILKAASNRNITHIMAIEHHKQDITIPVVTDSRININYAGREGDFIRDNQTGRKIIFKRIPTESYQSVSQTPQLPPLPLLDKNGTIADTNYDRAALESWFMGHCDRKAQQLLNQAAAELGAAVDDSAQLLKYIAADPERRSFMLYRLFLDQAGAWPGFFNEVYPAYPEFAAAAGQPPGYDLNEQKIVTTLMDFYLEGYKLYRNQLILAGGTALGIGDTHQTPVGPMFGIYVIINALNTLVTGNLLIRTVDIPYFDLLILFSICLLATGCYFLTNIRLSWILLLLLTTGSIAAGYSLFSFHNLQLSVAPLLTGNLLCFLNILGYKLFTEERDRRFLHRTFQAYLAPDVIEDMYHNRLTPVLGGENTNATAYFTDIAGFSSFSECLSPHHLVELLNEYLSAMTDILLEEKGTLDKYEGDAIIAFFGAPGELPDHATRAVATAIKMQIKLSELRTKWATEKIEPGEPSPNQLGVSSEIWHPGDRWPRMVHEMRMRIGINTGNIIVGNMGSAVRMNYTMMGDAVNLAARLESAAKQYGAGILVSGATMRAALRNVGNANAEEGATGEWLVYRQIDKITVVGRKEPVEIYEPLALRASCSAATEQLAKAHNQAMQLYFERQWQTAADRFAEIERDEALQAANGITPSTVMRKRCEQFITTPPAADWDGTWSLQSK